jgi:hypothetical protein
VFRPSYHEPTYAEATWGNRSSGTRAASNWGGFEIEAGPSGLWVAFHAVVSTSDPTAFLYGSRHPDFSADGNDFDADTVTGGFSATHGVDAGLDSGGFPFGGVGSGQPGIRIKNGTPLVDPRNRLTWRWIPSGQFLYVIASNQILAMDFSLWARKPVL